MSGTLLLTQQRTVRALTRRALRAAGYEWFMATEAVKRNPNITVCRLRITCVQHIHRCSYLHRNSTQKHYTCIIRSRYGLPWSFPAWLYHGTNQTTCHTDWIGCVNGTAAAEYIAEWVAGAKRVHGIHVSYVGWHNEHPWRPEWVALLYLLRNISLSFGVVLKIRDFVSCNLVK